MQLTPVVVKEGIQEGIELEFDENEDDEFLDFSEGRSQRALHVLFTCVTFYNLRGNLSRSHLYSCDSVALITFDLCFPCFLINTRVLCE